ncbi:exodeoxyribonuclease VII small subunit [Desulfobacula toluolica]|uniref:Exodeoxyribonuclease 7 small subunit n=1 Tax=Desulfobacula toluolica (strain DSM 7467 / Tol2) TaxID=651182 RepID=K0NGR3_DESTT|nr:exodeoxyribonuclease VII small subunit [Desulfobacula toluolica]CCK80140.1 XseB: exodeoxyribonuclease VII, small subunit [Desulfobacula toluolica Tol2]
MAKKKTFEEALKELEDIVRQMESGDLPLEDAVKKYESGMKQSKYCLDLLDKTEQKISLLTKDLDGNVKEEPFENE